MKKIFVSLFTCSLLLVGCSSVSGPAEGSPEAVVELFFKAYAENDIESIEDLFYYGNRSNVETALEIYERDQFVFANVEIISVDWESYEAYEKTKEVDEEFLKEMIALEVEEYMPIVDIEFSMIVSARGISSEGEDGMRLILEDDQWKIVSLPL